MLLLGDMTHERRSPSFDENRTWYQCVNSGGGGKEHGLPGVASEESAPWCADFADWFCTI
jgi:hypothetical protein